MYYSKDLVGDYSEKRAEYNETDEDFFTEIRAIGVTEKKVLDLGCGDGKHAVYIKELGALQVVGIDINHEMIELAQRHTAGKSGISFLVSDGVEIPIDDSTIDLIVSNFVIHYFKDAHDIFNEINRVLNPGGYFVGTFNIMEASNGFEYLYNQEIPIQLGAKDDAIVVYNLAKSRTEILEAITDSGLVIIKEKSLYHPNATISDTFLEKSHLTKHVVLMVLQKPF